MTAVFEPDTDHPSRALLNDKARPGDGEIVLRRTLGADGRTRAFVNDEAVGVGLLKDLGGLLLEVHGQADDRGLFDVSTHRALLDAFGGHGDLIEWVGARYAEFARARQALAALAHARRGSRGPCRIYPLGGRRAFLLRARNGRGGTASPPNAAF